MQGLMFFIFHVIRSDKVCKDIYTDLVVIGNNNTQCIMLLFVVAHFEAFFAVLEPRRQCQMHCLQDHCTVLFSLVHLNYVQHFTLPSGLG